MSFAPLATLGALIRLAKPSVSRFGATATQAMYALLASLLFATMSMLVKLAARDYTLAEIVLFRTLPGTFLLFAYARANKFRVLPLHFKLHVARDLSGLSAMVLSFYAVSALPLSTATTLDYTAPIFLAAYTLASVRSRRLHNLEFVAILGAFVGVILLLQPSLHRNPLPPFVAGLAAGALAAVAWVQIRRLIRAGEEHWRIVFFFSLSGMLAAMIALPFTPPSKYSTLGLLTLIGVGITGLGAQLAMTRGFSGGSGMLPATLQYTTVAFAVIYGYVLWDDRLSWLASAGLILIVISSVLALWVDANFGSGTPQPPTAVGKTRSPPR